MNRKEHWENIYSTKELNEVSWYQPKPETSLNLIMKNITSKNDSIIDIGGGDSFLVDHLIDAGFTNVSVLDISEKAIERAQKRLGNNADKVEWIVSDIVEFSPTKKYDCWHDRAALHFLTNDTEVEKYQSIIGKVTKENSIAILGTFSKSGPLKCSGIEIRQYDKQNFESTFKAQFKLIDFQSVDHQTPFDTKQNFNFATLKRN